MAKISVYGIEAKAGTTEYNKQYYMLKTGKTDSTVRRYIKAKDKPIIIQKLYNEEILKDESDLDKKKDEIDPYGIIKETDTYIFYRNKVWSKTRDRYLLTVKFYQKYNSYCCPVVFESKKPQLVILNDI